MDAGRALQSGVLLEETEQKTSVFEKSRFVAADGLPARVETKSHLWVLPYQLIGRVVTTCGTAQHEESQDGRGGKGPLRITQSEQDPFAPCTGRHPGGF